MKIGLLAPSIYMSPTHFGDMIFAPRDLAVSLADGLVARGHEVFFFTAPDVPTTATIIAGDARLFSDEYKEAKLNSRTSQERAKWASFYNRKRDYEMDLTAQCFAMALKGKLDIIHSYHDGLAHFWEEATGAKVVYTLHDPLPQDEKSLDFWLLSKFSSHRYVSISNAFRRHGSLVINFVDTVYHGIPSSAFEFNKTPRDYMLFMGRMVPEKGLSDAIAAAIATNTRLKIGAPLPHPGEATEYFTREIEPFLAHPLIDEPGMVGEGARDILYKHAQALLFPIQWDEPFGMVMIEAMACGTPVIAYDRGSVSEIVRDGVTGFVVDPDKGIDGLVAAIKRIGEIDRVACRKHVEENFSVEKMVAGYEKVYEGIIRHQ